MALDISKLAVQVDDMGRALARREDELGKRGAEARHLLASGLLVDDPLLQKIEKARSEDAWRRGATPLGRQLDERRIPGAPERAITLIAADGSQVVPDRHAAATYYLINIGAIVLRLGSGAPPDTSSTPQVFYLPEEVYDADGRVRSEEYVGAQRNRGEIAALAGLAERERAMSGDPAHPIIALLDGPLLPWMSPAPENREAIAGEIRLFSEQLDRLRAAGVVPVGFVDRPGSAYVLRILELIGLEPEQITRDNLRNGRFRELTDRALLCDLRPGERTGLFRPNSEANDLYQGVSGDSMVFYYANMAPVGHAAEIARVEVPGWVASDNALTDQVQAAIYANCVPAPYPYVLARAHELAVVGAPERAALDEMLAQSMLRAGLAPQVTAKAAAKSFLGS